VTYYGINKKKQEFFCITKYHTPLKRKAHFLGKWGTWGNQVKCHKHIHLSGLWQHCFSGPYSSRPND